MLERKDPRRQQAWARAYVRSIVERDVRQITDVQKLDMLSRLLRALARYAGQLTNFTQLGGQIGLDDKTTRNYVAIFEHLFLVRRVESWFRNHLSRLIKTPKFCVIAPGSVKERELQPQRRLREGSPQDRFPCKTQPDLVVTSTRGSMG